MGIVKYNENRQFSISQALKDGWGKECKNYDELIGLKLQDRKKTKHIVTIENWDWFMGIFRVWFKEGGWLCLDNAIEQFKSQNDMKKERLKPGPKPKKHVRFEMRVTEEEKEKCISFYEQLKKDRINNIEVNE